MLKTNLRIILGSKPETFCNIEAWREVGNSSKNKGFQLFWREKAKTKDRERGWVGRWSARALDGLSMEFTRPVYLIWIFEMPKQTACRMKFFVKVLFHLYMYYCQIFDSFFASVLLTCYNCCPRTSLRAFQYWTRKITVEVFWPRIWRGAKSPTCDH